MSVTAAVFQGRKKRLITDDPIVIGAVLRSCSDVNDLRRNRPVNREEPATVMWPTIATNAAVTRGDNLLISLGSGS